jgi:hypothetical protein
MLAVQICFIVAPRLLNGDCHFVSAAFWRIHHVGANSAVVGFLKGIRTEYEVQQLISRCSRDGRIAGWKFRRLGRTLTDYPTARSFFDDAVRGGWTSRDVAMAVVGGIIVDTTLDADLNSDYPRMKELTDFGMRYVEVTSDKAARYDGRNVLHIAAGMSAILQPYFLARA